MKKIIALLTLLVVLSRLGWPWRNHPPTCMIPWRPAGNYKTFLSLVDKANVQELKSMQGPFTCFCPR